MGFVYLFAPLMILTIFASSRVAYHNEYEYNNSKTQLTHDNINNRGIILSE